LGFFGLLLLELASIMPEFPCYCWTCNRNSVWWFMFDLKLCSLLGTDELVGML
jgi:hypothetical protein